MNKLYILLIMILSLSLFGCSEEEKTATDPNVINRVNESEYAINVTLSKNNNADNLSYDFSVSKDGIVLKDNKTHAVKWDFGDANEFEAGLKKTHKYAKPGVFSVTAFITDNITKKFRTTSIDVVSGKEPDIYNTEIMAYRNEDRRAFKLVGSAISAQGETLKYSWTFGDGTPATIFTNQNTVDHVFRRYGDIYNISLTVDNSQNNSGSKVKKEMKIETQLPDLEYKCASGGPAFESGTSTIIGQFLICSPVLTGGEIPDVVYHWEYYNEIQKDEYDAGEKDQNNPGQKKNMIVVKSYDKLHNMPKDRYFKLDGYGTSNVNDSITYMFAEGGRKYIKVKGVSQNFLKENIAYESEFLLPSNMVLGEVKCQLDSNDKTKLTYTCSADAYSLPKKQNGDKYVAPLKDYQWSVYNRTGLETDEELEQEVEDRPIDPKNNKVVCYKEENGQNPKDVTNKLDDEKIFKDSGFKKCVSTVTYKADKYDISPEYSVMLLIGTNYEDIEGEQSEELEIENDGNFQVKPPVITDIKVTKSTTSNPDFFTYIFEPILDIEYTRDISYHWSFGDGVTKVSNTPFGEHTYSSADGEFKVEVYATSSKFTKTDVAKTIVKIDPSFKGTKFVVQQIDKENNRYTFETDWRGVVTEQGKERNVKTEYILRLYGPGYEKAYKLKDSDISEHNGNIKFETVTPTIDNYKDNNTLSIPYGFAFNAELQVINTKKPSKDFYVSTTVPLKDLGTIEFIHPGVTDIHKPTEQYPKIGRLKLDYLRDAAVDDHKGQKVPNEKLKCKYELNPKGINSDMTSKWYLSDNGECKDVNDVSNYEIEVDCTQDVYICKRVGYENDLLYKKILATVSQGPFVSPTPRQRFLDIKLGREGGTN